MDPVWLVKCLVIGAAGGLIGGLLGVGGGIIMVPLLMALLGMPIHDAKADSLGVIVIISIAGTIKHQMIGKLDRADWLVILAAGIAAVVCGPLGVALSQKLDTAALKRVFAIIMLITGIKYLLPARPAPAPAEAPAVAAEAGQPAAP